MYEEINGTPPEEVFTNDVFSEFVDPGDYPDWVEPTYGNYEPLYFEDAA